MKKQSSISPLSPDISQEIPLEWGVLTRAVDLINHGYSLEGFIIGFALLDELSQDFVRTRLPNLTAEKAEDLLRRIASNRLQTCLGPLTRLAVGASPLDDRELTDKLRWLNGKRNEVLHRGGDCSYDEACRGLKVIAKVLRRLNDLGGDFRVPTELQFW